MRTGRADDVYDSLRAHAAELIGLGDIELTIDVIQVFAIIFASRGDPPRTAVLLGTAQALREQAAMPRRGPDAELLEEHIAPARGSMSGDAWAEHFHAGRRLSAEEALAKAGGLAG